MTTMIAVTTGQNIKAQRRKCLMTQDVLAKSAGISQKQLSKIENDEVEPRFSTLHKVAEALHVRPHDLLD